MDNDATRLSAIVLIGLALTVVLMAILAIIYSVLGIEDESQALGLPEGSVRALLAFSLVLIFVCLGAFLFTAVNKRCDNCAKTLSRVTDAQLSDLKANFIVAAEQAKDDTGKLLYEQIPAPGDSTGKTMDDLKHPYYTVTYYPKQSTDSADFAKQIFTTIATIFVSVVSFYFGSSVTSSAVRAGASAALGPDGDKQVATLQSSLTSALADSHNAQIAVNQASENLKKAQDEAAAAPSDQGKQAAVAAAQKTLDDANKDLADKQAKVQAAQKAVNDAKTKGSVGSAGQGKSD
jgi:hypothetical protein